MDTAAHNSYISDAELADRQASAHSICINILHINADAALLKQTLDSIWLQRYAAEKLTINVLSSTNLNLHNQAVSIISINSIDQLPVMLYSAINNSSADIMVLARSGDRFFDEVFYSVSAIFKKFDEIEWLTGIETMQSPMGYSVIQGNTSIRRWNKRLFRRNMYQNGVRYIPSAGTFWRRQLWDRVKDKVNFVSGQFAHDDLWDAFLSVSKPYACDVYFSAQRISGYNASARHIGLAGALVFEHSFFNRITEFLYTNNVPYLRAYYRYTNRFAQVVRFDHKTQSYFLSDY